MWYLWILPVVLLLFLWALNEHLSGRVKDVTSGVLAWTLFGLIVAAFCFSGWRAGVACIVSVPVLGLVLTPVARSISRSSSGYSDPRIAAYNRQQMGELRSGNLFETMEKQAQEESKHKEQAVRRAMAKQSIQRVLTGNACAQRDLEALYDRTEIRMLPPDMRELALRNPSLLEFFLRNSTASTEQGDYMRNVRDKSTHIMLTLWVSHDPAASRPPRGLA